MAAGEEGEPRRCGVGVTTPMVSVDPAGDITVRRKDGGKEAQEGEGGTGRYRGRIRHVRGVSEACNMIGGGGGDKTLEIHHVIRQG